MMRDQLIKYTNSSIVSSSIPQIQNTDWLLIYESTGMKLMTTGFNSDKSQVKAFSIKLGKSTIFQKLPLMQMESTRKTYIRFS